MDRNIQITRKQLYDEIWELSLAGVSRKYDLNYAKLRDLCRKEDIPIPPSGYWTRKNLGKDVSGDIRELTGAFDQLLMISAETFIADDHKTKKIKKEQVKAIIKTPEPETEQVQETTTEPETEQAQEATPEPEIENESADDKILSFLPKEEHDKVLSIAHNLMVDNTRLHRVLVSHRRKDSEYRAQLRKTQNTSRYNARTNRPSNEPLFFKEMSDEGVSRSIGILNAVFRAVEKLGGSINDDMTLNIRQDVVRIRMAESQDKVIHELTKQEAKELLEYNEAVKKNRWASKPQIRKYDKVYTGRLRIVFGGVPCIRDSESQKLEDSLGDILISLYKESECVRIARVKREEKDRKRAEEERIREEQRQRKEKEIEHTRELVNLAEDYRIATEIRNYIKAAVEKGGEEITMEWISWAEHKADWYDPTVAREDAFLGRREHKKSKEEKDRELNNSVRKSWYW
ncbi:hypothetical protein [Baileyella intestinalis]|uniref:hypothetical protein n=1 Tax=Baileyella intestinalis TaxID=2606709 RepID=UPI0022E46E12|nr:hypothetical protein [Baileyella intestinalis]